MCIVISIDNIIWKSIFMFKSISHSYANFLIIDNLLDLIDTLGLTHLQDRRSILMKSKDMDFHVLSETSRLVYSNPYG